MRDIVIIWWLHSSGKTTMINRKENDASAFGKICSNSFFKEYVLVVEGSSDSLFYPHVFGSYGKIRVDRYIYDPKYFFKKIEYYNKDNKTKVNMPQMSEIEFNNLQKYDFVINVMNWYKANETSIKDDYFGFIDRDHGLKHKAFDDDEYISVTDLHDLETNVVYYCLPQYLKGRLTDNNYNDLFDIVWFCLKQGLLQGASLNFEIDNPNSDKIDPYKEISIFDFIDYDHDPRCIKFDEYVKNLGEKESDFLDDVYYPYLDAIEEYKKANVKTAVIDWIGGRVPADKNDYLKKIFKLINGHILVKELFIVFGLDFFEIEKSKYCSNDFLKKMFFKSDSKDLLNVNPLSKYIKHRSK